MKNLAVEMPYDLDLEAGILGALMHHNELHERLSFLVPDSFYSPHHAELYRMIIARIQDGKLANPLTLPETMQDDPEMQRMGGSKKYLGRCFAMATSFPVEEARSLVEIHQTRELLEFAAKIQARLPERTCSPVDFAFEMIGECEKFIDGSRDFQMVNGDDVMKNIIAGLTKTKAPTTTGLKQLDDAMGGGLYAGKSYGFAARKKVGKTILAGTISHNLARKGVKHLFICGEMSPEEIHQRTLARVGNFFPSAFRSAYGEAPHFKEQLKRLQETDWGQKNIIYRNAPGLTFEKLKRTFKQAVMQYGVKGIILDYWQLVGGKDGRKSQAEHLEEVAQWIADFGRKHGVWSITMAQINQEGNTRGGEGMRLAFDQVYKLEADDITMPHRWLEMMDTRYTAWLDVGSKECPGLTLNMHGPYFEGM
jgi:replicative DNA helicase